MAVSERFPALVVRCIGQMILYLRTFELDGLLKLLDNFVPLLSANLVVLDKCTLEQLEVLESAEGNKKANLFWLLNLTKTSFGSRQMRSWILHPMKLKVSIDERLDAVEELVIIGRELLEGLLTGLPDLERGICRLFHHKCEPKEFINIMQCFLRVFGKLTGLQEVPFKASLLSRTVKQIPDLSELISSWLACLSSDAANAGKMGELFQIGHLSEDPYPDITLTNADISAVEKKLDDTLVSIRQDMGLPRLKYSSVAHDEYLIELTHKQAATVPAEWIVINKTKAVKRFHTPRITQQYQLLVRFGSLMRISI